MKSVGCTLTLKSDANLTCDLAITLDDQGRRTWKRIDSPQRRLRFGATSGTWRFDSNAEEPPNVLLRGSATGLIVAALVFVPRDFLDIVACAQSLSGGGNFTTPERDLKYALWMGCA